MFVTYRVNLTCVAQSGIHPKTLRVKLRGIDECRLADYPLVRRRKLEPGEVFKFWHPDKKTWLTVDDIGVPFRIPKCAAALVVRPSSVQRCVGLGQVLNAMEVYTTEDGWIQDTKPVRFMLHEKAIHARARTLDRLNIVCWGTVRYIPHISVCRDVTYSVGETQERQRSHARH